MKHRTGTSCLAYVLVLAFAALLAAQGTITVQSFYDDLGRLVKVVDSSGNEIDYVYDAAGNLLQIQRPAAPPPGAVAIFNVTPQRGPVGATVTIQGQGFGPNPAADVVRFNGTPATVVSATGATLAVTVPAGATTGAISVTVGGSSAQGPGFTVVVALVSITLSPANPSIPLGTRQQFTATGNFSDNSTRNLTSSVTWTSSSANVARINAAGNATSVGVGMATITAVLGAVAGSLTLTVNPPAVVSIAINPANPSFRPGVRVHLGARGTLTDGTTPVETTASIWSSSDPTVATVSNAPGSQGLVTTVASGTATIIAALGSVSGSTILTATQAVLPPPSFAPRFCLVTSSGFAGAISSFAVDAATGLFRMLGYANVSGAASSAIDPSGHFAYFIGPFLNDAFIGFSIDPNTAALTPISGSPFPPFSVGLDIPGSIAVDPTGTFVFVTGQNSRLWVYTIGPGGALTEVPGVPFLIGRSPLAVTVDPSGNFVYVVNSGDATISAFSIDPVSGVLTPVSGSPFATRTSPVSVTIEPSGRFLYVTHADFANGASNNISAYAISSASGALTPISGSPFTAGNFPESATADPSGKFLYVLNHGTNNLGNVSAFVIDSTSGALSPVPQSPFSVGLGPLSMTVDPSGKFLYVANAGRSDFPLPCCQNDVTMYTIDTTSGALTGLRTFRTRGGASSVAFTKSSTPLTFMPKFAYVANQGDNSVSASSIDPTTGALTPVPNSPFPAGTGPVSVTSDPEGKFTYVANQAAGTISAYSIDPATGGMLPTPASPFPAGSGPASVTVDPSGRFAYVADQASNNVSAYSILSTSGGLTPIANSPFPLPLGFENGPFSVTVDARGVFAYVANRGSNDITNFLINPIAGGLSQGNSTTEYFETVGSAPVALTVDPTGNFVYVANSGSNNVSAYSAQDSVGGTLLHLSGSPFQAGTAPSALTVSPLGKFLYVANAGSNDVSAFSIDPTTGVLATIANSPFAAGSGPSSVAVDYSGKFLYVTNSGSNNVSVFSINPITGSLTAIPNSPFPAGTRPMSIQTTGTVQ